jgi:hypothetical protein
VRKTAKQTITKPVVTIPGTAVLIFTEMVSIAGMILKGNTNSEEKVLERKITSENYRWSTSPEWWSASK